MERRLNIEPYNRVDYKLCYHSLLFSALKYWGVDLAAFFSNDIFTYRFHRAGDHLLKCDNVEIVPEDAILKKAGLVQHGLDEFDENVVMGAIQQGYPVFAPIDGYYWNDPWYNAAVYQKIHQPHYFLIVGYELEEKTFTVIDVFDNGGGFKAFYNKIKSEMLRQCCHMYQFMLRGQWKLAVLDIAQTGQGRIQQNYGEIFRTNLRDYKSEIYSSFENIKCAMKYLGENMDNEEIMAQIAGQSANRYMGMNYKKVQAYEAAYFLDKALAVRDAYRNLSALHYEMVSLFRKMYAEGKYDRKRCHETIDIMGEIYEEEVKVCDMLFSLM